MRYSYPMFLVTFVFFCLFAQSGCDQRTDQGDSENMLPKASGASGELMIFIDTSLINTALGKEIQNIFSSTQPGLLQGERRFRTNYIDPLKINRFIKMHTNLVFVTLVNDKSNGNRKLQEYFPQEAIQKIKNNSDYFMFTKQDVYAKGQRILHLFSYKSEDLLRNLRKHKQSLRQVFDQEEIQRLHTQFRKAHQEKAEENLRKSHEINMLIPSGYQKAKNEKTFVWYRFPSRKIDRNFFIAHKKYESEKQFAEDSMLAWRNRIAKKHLFADPEFPESYILTETLETPVFTKTTLNGNYALEMRGLWRTNAKYLMGGPFVSYMFADTKTGKLYYIEGFVYAPGERKRELVRTLNALIRSIKPT